MKSICLVLPYFGKLPNYFEKYLASCSNNPTINWLIFTDDKSSQSFPNNVKVVYTTFEELCKEFNEKLGLYPTSPYKLCDFRVSYGFVFEEYLKGYDFFGWCDCDLIWGNIRKFVTNELTNKYDKIGLCGHFTLLRNTDEFKYLYKKINYCGNLSFKQMAQLESPCSADEDGGLEPYCIHNHLKHYIVMHDDIPYNNQKVFRTTREGFLCTDRDLQNLYKKDRNIIYKYRNQKLERVFIRDNKVSAEEVLYVHFQKRHFDNSADIPNDCFLIAPNYFYELSDENLSKENIMKVTKQDNMISKLVQTKIIFFISRIRRKLQI